MKNLIKSVLELNKYLIDLETITESENSRLETITDGLLDSVLTLMGLPKDNTVELGFDSEFSFCSDFYIDDIWEYLLSDKFKQLEKITEREVDEFTGLLRSSIEKYKQQNRIARGCFGLVN